MYHYIIQIKYHNLQLSSIIIDSRTHFGEFRFDGTGYEISDR